MELDSKNVVNDMSKSAIINKTKLPIGTDIEETDCKRISGFCTFPNVENILNNSLPQKEVILREAIPKYSMRAIITLTLA